VHLVAQGAGGVVSVQFQYSADSGTTWNNINSAVSESNGVYSTEWTVPVAVYNTTVEVRAHGLSSVNTPIGTDGENDTVLVSSSAHSVNISTPAGSAASPSVGVYQLPSGGDFHGVLSGTAGDNSATPDIELAAGNGNTMADNVGDMAADGTRSFSGVVDFGTNPSFADNTTSPATPNYTPVTAQDASDDVSTVTLYNQTIADIKADNANQSVKTGSTGTVTFTVVDQNGKAIAGARVFSESTLPSQTAGGPTTPFIGTGGYKTTNSLGQVTFTGLAASSGGTASKFYANVGGTAAYDPGVDFERTVTVTSYDQVATTLAGASKDGSAFDRDEFASGDITETLTDQNGNPIQGQVVNYQWTGTKFSDGTATTPSSVAVATTNANGVINVPLPSDTTSGNWTLNAWIEKDGNPGEGSGDFQAAPLNLKIGQAQVVWNDGDRVSVKQGTTQTFKGSVQLEDGTKLPNRSISVDFYPNGDAVIAAQADQSGPGTVTRNSDTNASVKTDANGDFGVAVADPAGTITTSPDYGDDLYGTGAVFGGNWLETDFMDTTVAQVHVYGSGYRSENVGGWNDPVPGVPQQLNNIRVTNAANQTLVGVPVTVSVDHGYITPDTNDGAPSIAGLTPATAPAEGGLVGAWKDLGQSVTVNTGDHGQISRQIAVSMGHDDGFADGDVTTTVSIKAAGVSPTTAPTIEWYAGEPMNPGAVTLAFSSNQTGGNEHQGNGSQILPKAATDLNVYLTPTATDQFGNVTGQDVDLTNAGVGSAPGSADSRFAVHSDDAGDQTVSGKVTDDTTTWTDGDTVTAGFQASVKNGSQTISGDAPTINWYDVDLSASSYNLTHNTANKVKPGTTVTETYTAKDQNGQPLAGYDVGYLRTGPDPLQDGNVNYGGYTNANGVSTYIFQGTKAGKAIITAIMGDDDGNVVPASQVNDQVTFAAVGQVSIRPHLKLRNSGSKDSATVQTSRAAKGAKVTFYRVNAHGHAVKIGTAKLGKNGKVTKKFSDKNGNKVTRYFARVAATAKTFKAKTPTKGIR
jgi:hypothetical protein